MSQKRQIKDLIDSKLREGWTLEQGKHYKLVHPSGHRFVLISRTPSDVHAYKNVAKDIEKVERLYRVDIRL
jgi:hypothetical protein